MVILKQEGQDGPVSLSRQVSSQFGLSVQEKNFNIIFQDGGNSDTSY